MSQVSQCYISWPINLTAYFSVDLPLPTKPIYSKLLSAYGKCAANKNLYVKFIQQKYTVCLKKPTIKETYKRWANYDWAKSSSEHCEIL